MAAPDSNYKLPPYSTEELETRISDGSLDLNRVGASLAELQVTVTAIANWINQQAQHQQQQARQPEPTSPTAPEVQPVATAPVPPEAVEPAGSHANPANPANQTRGRKG